ncbi:MAG TPA: helix-turn-helix transcriptional regulator [Thermoanaerobaculia bacterium]|nr:helix-turn-helix transcriptional regulator [Thermoanaerobaculia bacterium]
MAESGEEQAAGGELFRYLGLTLFVLRTLRSMSQGEFAERVGIRPNQISRYETGAVQPQLDQLGRLLSALEVTPFRFFVAMQQVERLAADLEDGVSEETVLRAVVGSLAGDLTRGDDALVQLLVGALRDAFGTEPRRRTTKGGRRWTERETGS